MTNKVVPIPQLGDRIVEAGRIRTGVKTGRAMKSIDTFRFTSQRREFIAALAELYGGECVAWRDPKANPSEQWEVITEADAVRVWIPPDGVSCWYEQWSGGGCARRCDGTVCTQTTIAKGQPVRSLEVACLCEKEMDQGKEMSCRPHTRLQVVLPDIPFGGVWRLESKGWNVAHEMPKMAEAIAQLQERGMVEGELRLEKRQTAGGSKKFVVPALSVSSSPDQLVTGEPARRSLEVVSDNVVAIGSGRPSTPWAVDDEVVDAELVEDDADEDVLQRVFTMDNAPRQRVTLTARQIDGLLSGEAKWSAAEEGKVVKT